MARKKKSSDEATKALTTDIKNDLVAITQEISDAARKNYINGMYLPDYIYQRFLDRIDPIEYCQNVLRNHYPESKKYLHQNQIDLIRAACNPKLKQVAGMMARQTGKTESIASMSGYLVDNYPQMKIGIFTPRLQQAEVSIGRLSTFFQMNEELLNNRLTKVTKDRIEMSNNSFVTAVSASDQSNIEGLTFDVMILDEAQKISNYTWSERIAPMGGACVLANSKIQLFDGTTETIENLVKQEKIKELPCIDFESGKLVSGKITQYCDVGIKDTITITLANGMQIGGTYQHPVIVRYNGSRITKKPHWERLDKIEVGMQVAVPRELPFFGNVHESKARFLGMMIGDGNYSYHIRMGTKEPEFIDYFKEIFPSELLNISERYVTKNKETFYNVGFRKQRDFFRKHCMYGQKSLLKRLPVDYESFDKESICELLAGIFDTDGCFSQVGSLPDISLGMINEPLLKQIQFLLAKIGVNSKVGLITKREKMTINNNEVNAHDLYCLRILGKDNIVNFCNNIKLFVKRHQERVNFMIEYYKTHKNRCSKIYVNTDMRFFKVTKVEYTGQQRVYDLTVDKYHSYIANGVFVHNTNAKIIKIGTPKTKNHFYDSVEGKGSDKWTVIRRDWTQCKQLWALGAIYLPDKDTGEIRPYSKYVVEQLMPKALKQEYFPNNPEVWTEGGMDIEDFKTQYMLEFIDGAGKFLTSEQVKKMSSGDFDWIDHGIIGEHYVAGIDFAGSNPDGDNTHITVLRITPDGIKQKVFAYEFKDETYPQQMYEIARLFGGYNPRFEVKKIFADYTGCGAPVIQTLQSEFGLTNIEGIIFNAGDRYTNSGMNLKNVMYGKFRTELDSDRFKYPSKEKFYGSKLASAGKDNLGFYHKMVGEWADLEYIVGRTINKKIEAPTGYHDDCCDADVLANFAAVMGNRSVAPRARYGRISRF